MGLIDFCQQTTLAIEYFCIFIVFNTMYVNKLLNNNDCFKTLGDGL